MDSDAAGEPGLPPGTLGLKGTIKTYRYLDDEEANTTAGGAK